MKALTLTGLLLVALFNAKAQERHWSHPDFIQIQYAGSIGYVSLGAGYDIFRNKARWSFHYGHIPPSKGGELNIAATKLKFIPKQYSLSEKVSINPFDVGLMVSYHMGSDFRSRWPDHRYPENYYWWQTSFRFHLTIESSATFQLRKHTVFKELTTFVELNSNELYLVSLFQNLDSIRAWDVFMIGAGARLHF